MAVRNLFSEYLRILTPDELTVLTVISEGEQYFSLTDMMEKEFVTPRLRATVDKDPKAKILPFKTPEPAVAAATANPEKQSSSTRAQEAEALAKDVAEELKSGAIKPEDVNALKNLSTENELFSDPQSVKEEENNVVDLGDFIIREKQRLKESQKRLKEQEVVGLYRRSASVDLEQEKLLKGDLSKSANGGLLVNKKQL